MSATPHRIIPIHTGCLLVGSAVTILAAVWFVIQLKANLDKNLRGSEPEFITVEQGELVLGGSATKNTILDTKERHKYEFVGKEGQNIEIRIHPFASVYMAGTVLAEGHKTAVMKASVDSTGGHLGDDLVMVVNLPETNSYQIVVDMVGSYTGDYEIRISTLPQ